MHISSSLQDICFSIDIELIIKIVTEFCSQKEARHCKSTLLINKCRAEILGLTVLKHLKDTRLKQIENFLNVVLQIELCSFSQIHVEILNPQYLKMGLYLEIG